MSPPPPHPPPPRPPARRAAPHSPPPPRPSPPPRGPRRAAPNPPAPARPARRSPPSVRRWGLAALALALIAGAWLARTRASDPARLAGAVGEGAAVARSGV